MRRAVAVIVLILGALALGRLAAQPQNGKFQLHFMNVDQGDGAILISPLGETVLFDEGVRNVCDLPVSYLQQLGVTKIDYHVTSHYHDDHIGCAQEIFGQFPLQKTAFDRGDNGTTKSFENYKNAVSKGGKRKTAVVGNTLTLDAGSAAPVTIEFKVVNGNGFAGPNENDRSVVALVHFGAFDALIGGDLSGENTSSYKDVETPLASIFSQVEVYKVHHHGSSHSSNTTFLAAIKPLLGIISAGVNSKHGHPTKEAMDRLHAIGVHTYWTTVGGGVAPTPGLDVVGGNIFLEMAPGANTFTVTHSGNKVDTFSVWGATGGPSGGPGAFSWSKLSNVYHHSACSFVHNISPANLVQGAAPPAGKTLHVGCPK